MNILIAGGSGFIGRKLCKYLLENGNDITIISRNKENTSGIFSKKIKVINWIDLKSNPLKMIFNHFDCIINLAGESIGSNRWNASNKERILNSRIQSTRKIITALQDKIITASTLINASAVGYYGPNDNDVLTESSSAGRDFLADVCRQWEVEAMKAEEIGVKVVIIRTGVVLGMEGALKRMLLPFRFYAGGSLGNGKQWMSWIHIDDLVRIYSYAIANSSSRLVINATAPNPVMMKEFSKTLGKVLHRQSIFNVPSFILKLVLGEMSDIVLKGQRVVPEKLNQSAFSFSFPDLTGALKNILNK